MAMEHTVSHCTGRQKSGSEISVVNKLLHKRCTRPMVNRVRRTTDWFRRYARISAFPVIQRFSLNGFLSGRRLQQVAVEDHYGRPLNKFSVRVRRLRLYLGDAWGAFQTDPAWPLGFQGSSGSSINGNDVCFGSCCKNTDLAIGARYLDMHTVPRNFVQFRAPDPVCTANRIQLNGVARCL